MCKFCACELHYRLKNKRTICLDALRKFNCVKNEEHRRDLHEKKQNKKTKNKKKKKNRTINIAVRNGNGNIRQKCLDMNNLRKGKPREFWRQFKRKNFTSNRNVNLSDFYEHFKNLASEINQTVLLEIDKYLENFDRKPPKEPTYPELDIPITRSEILKSIRNLKRNKAFGPDS